jgi:hypothetical protein
MAYFQLQFHTHSRTTAVNNGMQVNTQSNEEWREATRRRVREAFDLFDKGAPCSRILCPRLTTGTSQRRQTA